jgi:hypothetical protein
MHVIVLNSGVLLLIDCLFIIRLEFRVLASLNIFQLMMNSCRLIVLFILRDAFIVVLIIQFSKIRQLFFKFHGFLVTQTKIFYLRIITERRL